jgi:hypothetical protein
MYAVPPAPCKRTYAILRIYPGDLDPTEVTQRLGIEPTLCQWQGKLRHPGKPAHIASLNGWFLSSKDAVDSNDSRHHIDWILQQLVPCSEALKELQAMGARTDLFCFWESVDGHSGPVMSPQQIQKIADLELDCGYEVLVRSGR